MDETQRQSLLQAVAISAGVAVGTFLPQQRQDAFNTLEQFKTYDGRVAIALQLLQAPSHPLTLPGSANTIDVAAATKLFALQILQSFLKTGYVKLADGDRVALRTSVLAACRQLAAASGETGASETTPPPTTAAVLNDAESRMLAMKLSALLADIVVRDFPQRWPTFASEVFVPLSRGGLWCEPGTADDNAQRSRGGYGTMIGTKIALECLRIVTEDCTDSDYNAKISTKRRNDVLIGLNEVASQFLPLIFALLSEEYGIVNSAKTTLRDMEAYLASAGRTVPQMTPDERAMYDAQLARREGAGRLVADSLRTIEKFCSAMPLDWILTGSAANGGSDFVAALFHLMREDTAKIQVLSVRCLEQLATRKLEVDVWMKFVTALPPAIGEANEAAAQQQAGRNVNQMEHLVEQLPFHRGLSRMLASLLSAHVSHVTTDKDILAGQGPKYQAVAAYLNLLTEMLAHPSGRICGEQINLWVTLLRDPQSSKAKLLTPFLERVLAAFMKQIVRVRWEDVEEERHPFSSLIEASWTDGEEYDAWLCDLRSKCSQLLKFIGNTEPKISAATIHSRIQEVLSMHGNGEPRNHLNPANNQLTQLSEAVLQFEGITQPLDNILQGLPEWSIRQNNAGLDAKKMAINTEVRARLSDLAQMIVSWNPTDTWLKYRRSDMLGALKHYWAHDPSTLLQGVDGLLQYLNVEEWKPGNATNGERRLTDDVAGLRKRSGIALIGVSKKVPQHLVPWLAQLSERAKSLLSSDSLLPPQRMHLYEFLSCVATAVEDPVARANFIADVLANALEIVESQATKESLRSVENFMTMMGIVQAGSNPSSATDPTHVKQVSDTFVSLFSALNQLLSVGKRCNEAARKRPNGGIPVVTSAVGSLPGNNFPDEGPVGINDLAVNDPFVPLWPRILPTLIRVLDVTLQVWQPQYQAVLLKNPIQRYVFAISDDEAYLAMKQDTSTGGVFGEGGTAGTVVAGWDRRDVNLAPKWSGWFNELRNTSFQLLGLLSGQRALFAPEVSAIFPELVSVVINSGHLQAMEHRHFTQYLKQFIEILLLACPVTLYQTHLSPILEPVFEHVVYRLQMSWKPVLDSSNPNDSSSLKALTTAGCDAAASVAALGGEQWFTSYYIRGGLFVGDMQGVGVEAAVEKVRVELSRTFSDVLQSALALKGDWALVLANQAKEEQAMKKGDASKLSSGPISRINNNDNATRLNADGTPRGENEAAIEARKTLRINEMCRFILLADERVAYSLASAVVDALEYPDAYTCRRCTKICHRILEACAWDARYTQLIGSRMFGKAVKAIVTEPKWMVGIEWDMINLIRDIYVRLVLGQTLLPGGQGPAMQQPKDPANPQAFEQAKNADKPLIGGGILCTPTDLPREVFAGLPGIGVEKVRQLDADMSEKRSAKDQKDALRELLRVAAENLKQAEGASSDSVFGRADESEGLLGQNIKRDWVAGDTEKMVTASMVRKQQAAKEDEPTIYDAGGLFST